MPAPRKFTEEQLRDAALAIVDESGLDALTMRSLAARLGTGPMTIYNYVEGRDGLEALVIAGALAGAPDPPAPSADWLADVRAMATTLWSAARAHPNAIPLLLTRRTTDEATMDRAEALLGALRRGGFDGFGLLTAFRAVTAFVTGFAQTEYTAKASDTLDRGLGLDPDRYPGLLVIAQATDPAAREPEFTAALDFVLAGLRATAGDRT
jgi:AcrR family transcriptional regulator